MADTADESRPVSSFLFCKEDGEAIKFFIRPSDTKARLKPLIEERGGVVSSKLVASQEWIKLAADGDKVSSDDYVRTDYIDDCIAANQLLPVENYRIQQQPRPSSPSHSVVSNVSNVKGRSKYNSDEDKAIIAYIAKHPKCSYSGNQIWKKMELLKVTDHSWQSMKHRFLKKLVDELPRYVRSQEKRAEQAGSPSDAESANAGNEMDTRSSAGNKNGKSLETPSKEQNQSIAAVEIGSHSDSEPSHKTPSREGNQPVESQHSNGSDSDFDENLFRAAEKHTPMKTGADSQDAGERTGTASRDKEHPHGTSKMLIRPSKGTSNGHVEQGGHAKEQSMGTAESTTNTEGDSPLHAAKRRRKRLSLDSDVEDLVAGVSTDSDSQTLGVSPEDGCDSEESLLETIAFIKGAMKEYAMPVKTVGNLLFIHSGDFDAVKEHLENRGPPKDQPMWTEADDKKLDSSSPKDISDLCRRFGQEAVMKRQAFFNC